MRTTSKTWIGWVSLAASTTMALAMLPGCFNLDTAVYAEGNYDIDYVDTMRVFFNDDLVVELDAAQGGTIDIGEYQLEYDEFCTDEDFSCPSENLWGAVAIYQPLGYENGLLNAVNIGAVGEEGQRLAGAVDENGNFDLLLGLSASADENCLAVGFSTASGVFHQSDTERQRRYDHIEDGVIQVTYAGGCEVLEGVTISSALRFETDFTGVRRGDVDLGNVEPDPAIDENGQEVDDNLEEL